MSTVNQRVRMYELDHPTITISNLEQVYLGLSQKYPHTTHAAFQQYGKHAGFSNSFFEKYVFFPPGSTSRWAGGELVFMNAQPFPLNNEEGLGRIVVLKNADVRLRTLNEGIIQKILTEEGMKPFPLGALASPSSAPDQVKDSLRTRIFNKVLDVCDGLGLSREAAGRIWLVVIWSPFLLFILLAGWLWRRSRRESH